MEAEVEALFAEFEDVAHEAETMVFAPRALELQEAACARVGVFQQKLLEAKDHAIRQGDETAANKLLSMEVTIGAIGAELEMWVAIKHDAGEEAWTHLVEAQNRCSAAIRIRRQLFGADDTSRLENYYKKLLLMERMVFPPQVFCSAGGIAKKRECSICGEPYDDCDHVRGRLYMGKVCGVIITEIELEEVSLVDEPANKYCRVLSFPDGDLHRNKMTWRLEPAGARGQDAVDLE